MREFLTLTVPDWFQTPPPTRRAWLPKIVVFSSVVVPPLLFQMPPASLVLEMLPEMVLLVTFSVPPSFQMAPATPPPPAWLPDRVLLTTLTVPPMLSMPPALLAKLFVMAQLLTVSVPPPTNWMPPPFCPGPRTALAIVRPSSETLAALTRNTRTPAPPLTVRFGAPGPWMVRSLLTASWPLVRTMVPVTATLIVSPGEAAAI